MPKYQPIIKDGKRYLSIGGAVETFDTSRATVTRHMSEGKLPFHLKPNGYRYPLEAGLERLYDRRVSSSDEEFAKMLAAVEKLAVDDPPLSTDQRAQLAPLVSRAHAQLQPSVKEVA